MIKKLIKKFRKFFRPMPAHAVYTGVGYNIVINGHVWRYETTWHKAYKSMKKAMRQSHGAFHIEMRRIAPKRVNYARGSV